MSSATLSSPASHAPRNNRPYIVAESGNIMSYEQRPNSLSSESSVNLVRSTINRCDTSYLFAIVSHVKIMYLSWQENF